MKKIVLLCFFSLFFMFAHGQDKATRIDSLLTAYSNQKVFNGNVLVAEKGVVLFKKSYGYADEETQRKLNPETVFELASVSKQFTAMGIVLLQKQGKLSFDDPIKKYIPELSFYEAITIRNLLHHTAGLPDYMELFTEYWDKSKIAVNQDIVTLFATHKPKALFLPNEKYEYSNTGYALLGLIIEKVSKQSFGDYLKDAIFKPLQMNNTQVYRSRYQPEVIPNYANGYVLDEKNNKVKPDTFGKEFYSYYLDGIVGDGMVNSNLDDLLKWDRALYGTQLVNDSDKQLIFSSIKTLDGKNTNYGFGWGISQHVKYGKSVSHTGSWAGYLTAISRFLTDDKTIIILQNNLTQTTKLPIDEIKRILYNESIVDKIENKIALTTKDLDIYLGEYSSPEFPLKVTITKDNVTMMAQATGQSALPLNAIAKDKFEFKRAGILLEFVPSEKKMILNQGGKQFVFTKS